MALNPSNSSNLEQLALKELSKQISFEKLTKQPKMNRLKIVYY